MKNFILVTVFVALFASCKDESKSRNASEAPRPDLKEQPAVTSTKECYRWISNKDTVDIRFVRTADNVRGTLRYMWFEKDKSNGTINGVFKRDTLRADFKFQSEGLESVREVVFVRKENQLIQGNGEMEEKKGKMVFIGKLDFNNSITMKKIECE